MIRVDKQSKRTTTKKKNRINKSRVLKNIKNYQPKEKMQEKLKKSTKKLREREREREITFFVTENYTKNGRENDEFIVKCCE